MRSAPFAAQRRHTLYLMEYLRNSAPVYLDTEVDMTRVSAHRELSRSRGRRYSVVSYVLRAGGVVLAAHPEANAAIRGRWLPRVARYVAVDGKLTLDRALDAHRVVLSAVIPGVHQASLDDIQGHVDSLRTDSAGTGPQFARVRALDRLPVPAGRLAFRAALGSLRRRPLLLGTFSVTSLGHAQVDGFHSSGGTTITVGVGRIADRPVVRDGAVVVAPVMRLSLSFDHRVIDGAEAAEVLSEIKEVLERCPDGLAPPCEADPRRRRQGSALQS